MKKLVVSSPIPLYYQLREIIRDRIVSGEWGYGTEIPFEIKFCEEYNLSRATVRQALDGLVNEGLIDRKRGIGTFVVYNKVSIDFLTEPSFLNESNKKSLDDYSDLLFSGLVEVDGIIKKSLNIENAYHIKRIHHINKIPISLDSNYIIEEYIDDLPKKDIEKIVINKWIQNTIGIENEKNKTKVQAVKLNSYENEVFNFPPLNIGILIENTTFFNEKPVIFNRRLLRADTCEINFELILSNNKCELNNSSIEFINLKTDL